MLMAGDAVVGELTPTCMAAGWSAGPGYARIGARPACARMSRRSARLAGDNPYSSLQAWFNRRAGSLNTDSDSWARQSRPVRFYAQSAPPNE